MPKVVRIITYDGTLEQLETQLAASLPDGKCDFVSWVDIHIETTHTDIRQEKIGTMGRDTAVEDHKERT